MGVNHEGELYEVFIKHLDDFAIFLVDEEGRVATWNIGAEQLFGYTRTEIIGQPVARFYTADDIAAGVPAQELRDARTNGKAVG